MYINSGNAWDFWLSEEMSLFLLLAYVLAELSTLSFCLSLLNQQLTRELERAD
jgi:hypothetical protein